MRFSTSGFFYESVSPEPPSTPLGPFQIFQKLAEIFANEYLSPVSLTPLINIHSRICPRIFEKIRNGPNGQGPGDTDLWKKSDVENLVSDCL